ncbi:MAG: radical SAM protein, partial [Endomicrobiia bacterium]
MKLHLISLGCAKNLVDSEVVAGKMALCGFTHTNDINDADVIVLNTCAFIGPARKETEKYVCKIVHSINSKTYKLHKPLFIVTGCLPQIEKFQLLEKFPEIDFVFGVDQFTKISQVVRKFLNKPAGYIKTLPKTQRTFVQEPKYLYSNSSPRIVSTPKSYAYIKIADGCDNRCSYCLIPTIRGKYRERPIEDIVVEAKKLVSHGFKEIILISQDTTYYGMQIYKKQSLHVLIQQISKIPGLYWIRVLYTNPKHFYPELIKTISDTPQFRQA